MQTGDHHVNTQFTSLKHTLVKDTALLTHVLIVPQRENHLPVTCNVTSNCTASLMPVCIPLLCKLCILQNCVDIENFLQYAKLNVSGTVIFSFMVFLWPLNSSSGLYLKWKNLTLSKLFWIVQHTLKPLYSGSTDVLAKPCTYQATPQKDHVSLFVARFFP
jgi:hypothetical protein